MNDVVTQWFTLIYDTVLEMRADHDDLRLEIIEHLLGLVMDINNQEEHIAVLEELGFEYVRSSADDLKYFMSQNN